MKREDILSTAEHLITGDRQEQYGSAQVSFSRIAALWSIYLGPDRAISAHEVAALMALLKISRSVESPDKADSWIDLAGYAALAGELSESS